MANLLLNPDLDVDAIAATYARVGRVRIPGFMVEDGLRELHAQLVRRHDWRQVMNVADGILELSRDERTAMPSGEAEALYAAMHERACLGFQYRYEGLRIFEPGHDATDVLDAVAQLMAAAPMLAFLKTVVARSGLRFTEGQATAYAKGDFLTCHDDEAPGRGRVAAFVLGMTPSWRPEWGGLLLFHSDDDSRVEGNVPRFNTLDLFSVPQRHSVSIVTPSAPGRRLAITGWLSATSAANTAPTAACDA